MANPSLPPDIARLAPGDCLAPDERAAIADALRLLAHHQEERPTDAAATADDAALATWRALTQPGALHPRHPFPLHRALHALAFAQWDASKRGPRPVWIPGAQEALATNAAAFMASFHGDAWWLRRRAGHAALDWPLLQRVSVQSPELFWSAILRELGVRFDAPPVRVLDEAGVLGEGGGGGCCGGGGGSCCGNGGSDGSSSNSSPCCCDHHHHANDTKSDCPPLGPDSVRWLPGARLNIAAAALLTPKSPDGGGGGGHSGGDGPDFARSPDPWSAPCFDGDAYERGGDASSSSSSSSSSSPPALLWAEDGRPELVRRVSWPALRARAARVAASLRRLGVRPGAAVAIDMPMTCDSVAIYLGIVLHGAVVVSIADSFAPSEIAARLRISRASLVFTQDVVPRGGAGGAGGGANKAKALPLYARVLEARAPQCVVLPASAVGKAWVAGSDEAGAVQEGLRAGDLSWGAFLFGGGGGVGGGINAAPPFHPCSLPGDAPSNILFSSGTTGEPKAVVWSHVTPLRAAVDAWAHQDVRPGDRVCWPTNLGWMMGPWLVYASLLNGASACLYHGPPGGKEFVAFVAAARVTQLGLVPSIVRSWRAAGLLGGEEEDAGDGGGSKSGGATPPRQLPDWSSLRCFSSTGEASSPDDYHWLASRVAGYRPVIEYCGGTEIGGGFLSGTLLQPQAAATFSTPTLGAALVLLGGGGGGDEAGGGAGAEQSMHGCGAPPFVG
jgi:acyl-coenzyme A synthetase/AMP-(fatty) acid ligase